MKKLFFTVLVFSVSFFSRAQNLVGAWEALVNHEGTELRNVVIISEEGYQVATFYDAQTGAFVGTNGGTWSLEGNRLSETVGFDTEKPERVGTTATFEISFDQNELRIKDVEWIWKRIDNGSQGALAGAWLISGRMRDGKLQQRDTSRPRKTMKILSDTRFQWIAYNTETKQFMGTGGGTYTAKDGKYIENIEFFSRDNNRVGASLEFEYNLKDGDWHHSGSSSKGQPIYEVWSKRKK